MRTTRILSVALICVAAACAKSDKDAATDSANAMAAASANAGATGTGAAGSGAAGTNAAGTNAAGTSAAGTTVFAANSCIEGTWKKKDGAFTQTLTFNPGNKGEEVQSRDDKRTFEWGVKNDSTVEIHYTMKNAKNSDWNVTVDCSKGRLTNGVNSAFTK
jgi:hypothetical protein